MAFILGALFVVPTVLYGMNQISNTVDDMIKYDYKKYLTTKMSNMNIKSQILFLELELKSNTSMLTHYKNEYIKHIQTKNVLDNKSFENIKAKKKYYDEICIELKKQIDEKKKLISKIY